MPAVTQKWFEIEAYSNYLIFGAGIIVTLVGIALKRLFRTIPHIEVARQRQQELLSYSPEVARKLRIAYLDSPVTQLYGSTLTIRNRGTLTITDIHIELTLDSREVKGSFIDLYTLEDGNPKRRAQITTVFKQIGPTLHMVEVCVPYLNAFAEHKDTVSLNIFSDVSFDITKVSGAGAGWTSRYIDRQELWDDLGLEMAPSITSPFLNLAIALTKYLAKRA